MDWHNLADPPHGAMRIQYLLCSFPSVWICRNTHWCKGLAFWQFWMSVKKKVQSKQEALLYESGPLASISFDRSISSRAHSHVSCGSLMSTVRISLAKRKVLGGEWEHPGPAVLPCPLWRTFPSSWLPNQSASCRERELPCPCHNKWLPWLQHRQNVKLSAAHNRPYLTKTVSADAGMELNEKDIFAWYSTTLYE